MTYRFNFSKVLSLYEQNLIKKNLQLVNCYRKIFNNRERRVLHLPVFNVYNLKEFITVEKCGFNTKKAKVPGKNYVKTTIFPKGTCSFTTYFHFQSILPSYLTKLNLNSLNVFTVDFINR